MSHSKQLSHLEVFPGQLVMIACISVDLERLVLFHSHPDTGDQCYALVASIRVAIGRSMEPRVYYQKVLSAALVRQPDSRRKEDFA